MSDDLMVWMDIETTGLQTDPSTFSLEIGMMLTDKNGVPIDSVCALVCHPSLYRIIDFRLDGGATVRDHADIPSMDAFVYNMHTDNGLFKDLTETYTRLNGQFPHYYSPESVAGRFRYWLSQHGAEPNKHPLVGSTVNFDREFLNRDFPDLDGFFHYRNIDVSTLKGLAALHRPDLKERWDAVKPENKAHRPIDDLLVSAAEYRFYLAHFLKKEIHA